MKREIFAGDNLEFLGSVADGEAQIVYMDPPFASGRDYKAVLRSERSNGDEMVDAFSDRWTAEGSRYSLSTSPASRVVNALAPALTRSMALYLQAMAPRIDEAWRVLDERGSLYLHCDASASHYLKVLLDATFGPSNFRNEIIWRRTHAHSSSKRFGPVHDVILFYSKSSRYFWNAQYVPYSEDYLNKYYSSSDAGGAYQLITCTGPGDRTGTKAHYEWRGKLPPAGRHWAWRRETMEELDRQGRLVYSSSGTPRLKRYIDEAPGVAMQDVWSDIPRLDANSAERVGYDTQKPIALISRILEASSEPGALVLDPYAGSGTTAVAAERLGRQWQVADMSLLAASVSLGRVRQESSGAHIKLLGFPSSESAARSLREQDPTTYGAWGTAMLATRIDRNRSTGDYTRGNGVFASGQAREVTHSWVPLRDARMSAPIVAADGIRGARGFVLGSPHLTRALSRGLGARPKFTVTNVAVKDAVSVEGRRRGMVSTVVGGAL